MRLPWSDISLREIANWQLLPETCSPRVELPKLQRGFVWEPFKVMDLWDSILRGFPIGSMMVSTIDPGESADDADKIPHYWLLDGQQRATSIAIGFYNPWNPEGADPTMWRLKSIPTLWIDLLDQKQGDDQKMFFTNLVTQSHPWGYKRSAAVIDWRDRKYAAEDFKLESNYANADLKLCFPWMARFPVPLAFLIDVASRAKSENIDLDAESSDAAAWESLVANCHNFLPECWHKRYGKELNASAPGIFVTLMRRLSAISAYNVHINLLSSDAEDNDEYTTDDNSLLFVRMNTGGVVLGGEELIFSLFKSAFPQAKDAVENSATGFMAPSKLFGLLVRLAASAEESVKLARPVSLREFKKQISPRESSLRLALTDLLEVGSDQADCKLAKLMNKAREVLCGSSALSAPFSLPEAAATRMINDSPDVFLGLLYWLNSGGYVEIGTEDHRRLLGRYTILSWFLPGNARAKQDMLRDWLQATGNEIVDRLWSSESLRFIFARNELAVPVFHLPAQLAKLLFCDSPENLKKDHEYGYSSLSGNDHDQFWNAYSFLKMSDHESEEYHHQRLSENLRSLLGRIRGCRAMLLYAQRNYVRKRFGAFAQWELTLKDTNCPWDWDHIYPSASGLHHVDDIYKNWYNTIGNLRVEGLSENRRDGCDTPTEKLAITDSEETPGWCYSAISEEIWKEMQSLQYRNNAIKEKTLARQIC